MKALRQAGGYKAKCDKLVREILLKRDGQCLRCGSTNYLQVSHIISRRYSATRCDLRNVQLLCAKDHMYYTNWPREFSKWITASIGSELYDELRLKAEAVTKVDWEKEYERLQIVTDGGRPI